MSEQIWFKDPTILFAPSAWMRFVPTSTMATADSLNAVVRFSIYFSVLLFLTTGMSGYLLAIPLVMVASVFLYKLFPNGKLLESFKSSKAPSPKKYTMPTPENPFMNPLLTEIKDNPNRAEAAPVTRKDVKVEMYKNFQHTSDMYMDTSDLFDQAQAMRTFHTLQASTIPSDQDGFLKWLSKGLDQPDYSSAPPARHAKILNEGYVHAKGSMSDLSSSTAKPTGVTPSGAASAKYAAKQFTA